MDSQQFFQGLASVAVLGIGLHIVVTRRAEITAEDDDEPYLWLYGWRAVAFGLGAVLLAVLGFASAAGWITWLD